MLHSQWRDLGVPVLELRFPAAFDPQSFERELPALRREVEGAAGPFISLFDFRALDPISPALVVAIEGWMHLPLLRHPLHRWQVVLASDAFLLAFSRVAQKVEATTTPFGSLEAAEAFIRAQGPALIEQG